MLAPADPAQALSADPLLPATLAGLGNFALALLLAFRLRAAYERWWMARTSFEARLGWALSA